MIGTGFLGSMSYRGLLSRFPVFVADYATLRGLVTEGMVAVVTGLFGAANLSGVAGMFLRDDNDTTSTDDGGTVIVAANGKRWKRLIDGPIKAEWFGVPPGNVGVANYTTNIKAMIDSTLARRTLAGNSGVFGDGIYVGTAPRMELPYGVYPIDADLTSNAVAQAINYQDITGNRTILVATNDAVNFFGGVGYQNSFSNMILRRGNIGISVRTANIDASKIDIDQMDFHRQLTACIKSDNNSNSTILNMTRIRAYQDDVARVPGHILKLETLDWATISDSWLESSMEVGFENRGGLNLLNTILVDGATLQRWIDNYGWVDIDHVSFGGHNSGKPLIRNHADVSTDNTTATRISIKNTNAYSLTYVIELYKLPNIITLQNIDGLASPNNMFYFHTTLTYVDFFNWQKYGTLKVDNLWIGGLGPWQQAVKSNISTNGDVGRNVFLAQLARTEQIQLPRRERIRATELRGSGGQGGGWTVTSSNMGLAYAADAYGVQNAVLTATADNASFDCSLGTYLNQAVLTYGRMYVLHQIVDVEAQEGADVSMIVCGARKYFHLGKGKHILPVPFVYLNNSGAPNAAYDTYSYSVSTRRNGGVVRVGRHILTEGYMQYTGEVLVMEAAAGAPAAYTVGTGYDTGYYQGDYSYRTDAAAAGPWGDFRTVAGTWKATANLVP